MGSKLRVSNDSCSVSIMVSASDFLSEDKSSILLQSTKFGIDSPKALGLISQQSRNGETVNAPDLESGNWEFESLFLYE